MPLMLLFLLTGGAAGALGLNPEPPPPAPPVWHPPPPALPAADKREAEDLSEEPPESSSSESRYRLPGPSTFQLPPKGYGSTTHNPPPGYGSSSTSSEDYDSSSSTEDKSEEGGYPQKKYHESKEEVKLRSSTKGNQRLKSKRKRQRNSDNTKKVKGSSSKEVVSIDFEALRSGLETDTLTLIDARPANQVAITGMIPKSANIPAQDLVAAFSLPRVVFNDKYGFPVPPQNTTQLALIVQDKKDRRKALKSLQQMGYSILRVYEGGIQDWISRYTASLSRSALQVSAIRYEAVLREILQRTLTLVDVRPRHEAEVTGIIPGSVNIPTEDIPDAFTLTPEEFHKKYRLPLPSKNTTQLAIVTRTTREREAAIQALYALGYSNIQVYEQGFLDWVTRRGLGSIATVTTPTPTEPPQSKESTTIRADVTSTPKSRPQKQTSTESPFREARVVGDMLLSDILPTAANSPQVVLIGEDFLDLADGINRLTSAGFHKFFLYSGSGSMRLQENQPQIFSTTVSPQKGDPTTFRPRTLPPSRRRPTGGKVLQSNPPSDLWSSSTEKKRPGSKPSYTRPSGFAAYWDKLLSLDHPSDQEEEDLELFEMLRERYKEGTVKLVEIRDEDSVIHKGKIPGSAIVPLEQLHKINVTEKVFRQIFPFTKPLADGSDLVVTCDEDRTVGEEALRRLHQLGFIKTTLFPGCFSKWREYGGPVEFPFGLPDNNSLVKKNRRSERASHDGNTLQHFQPSVTQNETVGIVDSTLLT